MTGNDEVTAYLATIGAEPAEITDAIHDDRLWELAADVLLATPRQLTASELAERAGVPPDRVDVFLRALGHPEPSPAPGTRVYGEADVEVVRAAAGVVDIFPDPAAGIRLLRVFGLALTRITDAAVTAYVAEVEGPAYRAGRDLLVSHVKSQVEAVARFKAMADAFPQLITLHALRSVQRNRAVRRDARDYETVSISVGFVDLVGFTSLSSSLTPLELGRVISDFETRTYDIVTGHDGQVIKHIGDEVMFVAFDAPSLCETALGIVSEFAGEHDVTPRGGLAYGPLLSRDGDFYGAEVNLASRLADIAVPNELLVPNEMKRFTEKATDAYCFEPAGRRQLKGFADPVEVYSLTAS